MLQKKDTQNLYNIYKQVRFFSQSDAAKTLLLIAIERDMRRRKKKNCFFDKNIKIPAFFFIFLLSGFFLTAMTHWIRHASFNVPVANTYVYILLKELYTKI